jgi:hypothetical protein
MTNNLVNFLIDCGEWDGWPRDSFNHQIDKGPQEMLVRIITFLLLISLPGTGFEPDYQSYYTVSSSMGFDHAAAQSPVMPTAPMPSGVNQSFASVPVADDEEQCPRCGMFYMDHEFSSRTDTDNGEADNEASVLYGNLNDNDARLGNELYEAY